jgi:hypothetical protein
MGKWNKKSLRKEALKYKTKSEFKNNSQAAYREACAQGCLEEISQHLESRIKKYTLRDLQKRSREKQGKCLSQDYLGIDKKHKFECKRGHKWETIAKLVMEDMWCSKCFNIEKRETTTKSLVEKMDLFFEENNRAPTRREFGAYRKDLPSPASAVSNFGSWNNFLEVCGFDRNLGIFGPTWRRWEALVETLLKEEYPKHTIYKQHRDPKTRTIIDYYIPELDLAIDAKVSNYSIESRNKQYKKYLKTYSNVIFYCLLRDKTQTEMKGVGYYYSEDYVKDNPRKKTTKAIVALIKKDNEFRYEEGLITKDLIISQIRALADEIGTTPQMREFIKDSRFVSSFTGKGLFKSWNEAVKASGLKARKHHRSTTTRIECFNELKDIHKELSKSLGRSPTGKEVQYATANPTRISYKTIREVTGKTLKENLKALRLTTHTAERPLKYTDDELGKLCENVGLKWIEGENGRTKEKILVKCIRHGLTKEITIEAISSVKEPCPKCKQEQARERYQLTKAQIKKMLEKANLARVGNETYKNAKTKLKVKCRKCGNVFKINMNSVQQERVSCC